MFTPKSEIQQAFTWSHAVTYIAIPFNWLAYCCHKDRWI